MSADAPDILIAEIPKNSREAYRVRIGEYKGHRFIDVRIWYGDEKDRKPSGKGVAIRPDAIPAVIAALQEAQAHLGGAE